ncbi:Flp family type IVb pilin [Dyella sp. A6]|uniref:Flp family type IVb pilin n=1 Tax=Dyella aluminiiresistens TaxID=3069105 RepID=UPI002E7A2505|nr:Flp family type IVb pilin [Dyella sp. A6]
MKTSIHAFLAEEDGITALEYGVLAALVATIIVAVFGTTNTGGLGTILTNLLNDVTKAVSSV